MKCICTILMAVLPLFVTSHSPSAGEPGFQFRAAWIDAGEMGSPGKIDAALDKCQRAKLNVVFPDVMSHGAVRHKTSHYLHASVKEGDFDPLAYLLKKAHSLGMEVHPWYCVYYECDNKKDGLQPAKPEWVCETINGKPMREPAFLSPQIPGVNDYILSIVKDGLAYDVDGIHLDYIRYYGTQYDYSQAGRERFIRKFHFDPIDFLDRTGNIVPLAKDPYPIRVLRSNTQVEKAWESSWVECLMDRARIGFGFISEKPEWVDALPVPGALVVNCYYEVTPEMANALERYVTRGGDILWMDGGNRIPLKEYPAIGDILGVTPAEGSFPQQWRQLKRVGNSPLSSLIPEERFLQGIQTAVQPIAGSTVIAIFDSGEPAVIYHRHGNSGRTLFVGFNVSRAYTEGCARMVHEILWWFREQAGVRSQKDPLAVKRAQWIKWRSEHITELVRNVKKAVKEKDSQSALSVAGGFDRGEYYLIFRDSKKWLDEDLLDIANPMDYGDDLESLRECLESHSEVANKKTRKIIWPGLSIYTRKTVDGKAVPVPKDATFLEEELRLTQEMGFQGFTLFCTSYLTDEQIEVLARMAPGAP